MSMFSEPGEFPDTYTAPGPAAFSDRNGNGAEHVPEHAPEMPVDDVDILAWVASAPPAAVLMIAATGAALALLFVAIGKALRGNHS